MLSSSWLSLRLVLVLAMPCVLIGCGSPAPTVTPTQNPLVARYAVTTSEVGNLTVDFGTDTSYGRQTASYPVIPGFTPILVAGMKPSATYHMRAQFSVGSDVVWTDQDRVFTTGSIPVSVPTTTVTRTTDPALQASENPGVEMIAFFPSSSSSAPSSGNSVVGAFVTDRDGNPIWYYAPPDGTPQWFKLMPNGHVLVALVLNGSDSIIREIDLAGNTIRELHTTSLQQSLQSDGHTLNLNGFSHDFIPMENGHVIVLLSISQDFTDLPGYPGTTTVLGDALVDLDQNWNPVWVWSAFDHLDVNRHPMFFPDWTHSNAVLYNPNDGNLLLSVRHQSWLLYIDYQNGAGSGNILWRLGDGGDFNLPGNDPSQWFYAQHFPSFVNLSSGPQMTLALFDNGDFRILDNLGTTCGSPNAPGCYSRATIFQLDQSTMQAQLLWQYLPGLYSNWGGAINQLQNGNVEFEMSAPFQTAGSRAMEVTQTGDPQVVWQMDMDGGFSYRTYRIPSLYPNVLWPN